MSTGSTRVGSTFGKYTLNRLLGKGGMGEVYEAYDTEKRRNVALKILAEQYAQDEQFRTRFQRESHAAAILQEPHVIPIHDWGEIDGNLYIDMRLVKGQTLSDLLASGPLDPTRAVSIVEQVAAALDAAHAERLIHRDVKPQNIIVTPGDFAYLLDFGIAEAQGDSRLTVAGYQIGTFDYMAPERFGDRPTTPAADVYSLACVLHEALTGRKPYTATSVEQVMGAHLTAPVPKPNTINPAVPIAFDDVIARGMSKDPDDRYGSAGALGRGARRALTAPASIAAQPDTVLGPSYPPPFNQQPYSGPMPSPTGPTAVPYAPQRSKAWVLPTVIAVAAALVLSGIGVVIGLLVNQQSNNAAPPATTNIAPPSYSAPPSSTDEAQAPSSSTTTETTPTEDPEGVSEQRLQQIAASDRGYVSAYLADRWVPQISSKRPGVVDEGVTWDNVRTLREHQQLRSRYPGVRLLWSGDWSTFSDSNFWVTIVGLTYPTSAGALAWCRGNGFDADHCAAKVVSTSAPIEGSTAYN
ncbi:protein kinase [Candidatus Mycobacterium wuenschmannii]|uniref:non-specific serine/threonine protein kinase n=1 Tax=Candidatus Mycobacterium wuenschmannii TaxID=3027808 RepID=A0ABY8W0X4_9MYCO|nr:serine/threonine protein kinase [Candidatus Mycobacterium wuenschmannii]WIM87429.1 protein kinase [Candidatus Mycobacterium wuenschmannii]